MVDTYLAAYGLNIFLHKDLVRCKKIANFAIEDSAIVKHHRQSTVAPALGLYRRRHRSADDS